jgi:hypothetical protein
MKFSPSKDIGIRQASKRLRLVYRRLEARRHRFSRMPSLVRPCRSTESHQCPICDQHACYRACRFGGAAIPEPLLAQTSGDNFGSGGPGAYRDKETSDRGGSLLICVEMQGPRDALLAIERGQVPSLLFTDVYAGDVGPGVGGPRQGNAPVANVLYTTDYSRNAVHNGTLDFGTAFLTKPSARWWIESEWATASGAHSPSLPHFSRGACRARCAAKRAGSPSYRHRHHIDASAALICRANGRAGLSISCPSGSTYETDSGITR